MAIRTELIAYQWVKYNNLPTYTLVKTENNNRKFTLTSILLQWNKLERDETWFNDDIHKILLYKSYQNFISPQLVVLYVAAAKMKYSLPRHWWF